MKKIIIILAIIITILSLNKEEQVIIPKGAIRFRIIANSNNKKDQQLKKEIINNLSTSIINNKTRTIDETRNYIKKELPKFTEIVDKTLKENNNMESFHINYGKNYFPKKEYKKIIYPEGKYESLVITIGKGKGDNFWCVLFPPLCLIDEDNHNIEYKSLVKEVLTKYF